MSPTALFDEKKLLFVSRALCCSTADLAHWNKAELLIRPVLPLLSLKRVISQLSVNTKPEASNSQTKIWVWRIVHQCVCVCDLNTWFRTFPAYLCAAGETLRFQPLPQNYVRPDSPNILNALWDVFFSQLTLRKNDLWSIFYYFIFLHYYFSSISSPFFPAPFLNLCQSPLPVFEWQTKIDLTIQKASK